MQKKLKYMTIALSVAALSKDKTTQAGAVILGPDGEGGPWGYNGAPRGCNADEDARSYRPEKYFWFEHAERNAIYTAARTGFRTVGCTMICTHYPCMDCSRAIVQAGIKRIIIVPPSKEFYQRWCEDIVRSEKLFLECGVTVEILDETEI